MTPTAWEGAYLEHLYPGEYLQVTAACLSGRLHHAQPACGLLPGVGGLEEGSYSYWGATGVLEGRCHLEE